MTADITFPITYLAVAIIIGIVSLFYAGFTDDEEYIGLGFIIAFMWPIVLVAGSVWLVFWMIYKAGQMIGDMIWKERAAYRNMLKAKFGDFM